MGQLVQITLNNGIKDLIFKPSGIDQNGVATLTNGTGVILGNNQYSLSTRTSSTRRKLTIKLDLPVVLDETVNGISQPKQVRKAYARCDFDFAVTSTTAERTAARKLMVAAIDSALAVGIIDNNEAIY